MNKGSHVVKSPTLSVPHSVPSRGESSFVLQDASPSTKHQRPAHIRCWKIHKDECLKKCPFFLVLPSLGTDLSPQRASGVCQQSQCPVASPSPVYLSMVGNPTGSLLFHSLTSEGISSFVFGTSNPLRHRSLHSQHQNWWARPHLLLFWYSRLGLVLSFLSCHD